MTDRYRFPKSYGDLRRDGEYIYNGRHLGSYTKGEIGLLVSEYGSEDSDIDLRLGELALIVEHAGLLLPSGFEELESPVDSTDIKMMDESGIGVWVSTEPAAMLVKFLEARRQRGVQAFATGHDVAAILAVPVDERGFRRFATPVVGHNYAHTRAQLARIHPYRPYSQRTKHVTRQP